MKTVNIPGEKRSERKDPLSTFWPKHSVVVAFCLFCVVDISLQRLGDPRYFKKKEQRKKEDKKWLVSFVDSAHPRPIVDDDPHSKVPPLQKKPVLFFRPKPAQCSKTRYAPTFIARGEIFFLLGYPTHTPSPSTRWSEMASPETFGVNNLAVGRHF